MWLFTSTLGSTGSWIVVLSEILIVFLAFGVKEKYLKYLFCLSVIYLAWLAYHFEPTSGNDLLYHFRMIEFAQNAGWAGLVVHYQFASNPALYVIYYFISKLPSVHWLPVLVVFIVYGVMFYIAYDSQIVFQTFNEEGKKIYSVGIAIAYMVFTMHYTYIISGVKNNMAFTIFVLATYLELVKKKNPILCWGLIIIALLIHPSIGLLIFVRLIAYSVKRWNNSLWLIILLLFPTILYRFWGNVDQTNSEFINNTLGKWQCIYLMPKKQILVFTQFFGFVS